jgi:hypothetical protein
MVYHQRLFDMHSIIVASDRNRNTRVSASDSFYLQQQNGVLEICR